MFGGEDFTESSKVCHVSMYLQKLACNWWASLKTNGIQPRTWKSCRLEMMKKFLTRNVRDDVLTAWRWLKLDKGETIQQYVNKFWDLHLKDSVFENVEFLEQRKQYCAGLPNDVCLYITNQKPKTISEVIHPSMVAMKIFSASKAFYSNSDKGAKNYHKEQAHKDKKSNGKKNEKGTYQGSNYLSTEELDKYCKENRCFKCGEIGHPYCSCSNKHAKKELLSFFLLMMLFWEHHDFIEWLPY